jgi:hypothetical protein
MDFLESLRHHKREGERERAEKLAEETRRKVEEEARRKAEEEQRRQLDSDRHLKQAEETLAGLPAAIRFAAAKGLTAAVLPNSFVEERPPQDRPSRPITLNRRTYYLVDWMIPFFDLCQQHNVPLTVVSERVNVGIGKVLHRTYNVLAVDLTRL